MKQPMLFFLLGISMVCSAGLYNGRALPAFLSERSSYHTEDFDHHSFAAGEVLDYQINFGFLKAGEGKMVVQDEIYQVKGNPCFKIDLYGKTTGAAAWLAKVDDNWGAYVDAVEVKPHLTYRNIQEGNYRKKEIAEFNYAQNIIHYKELDFNTGKVKETEKIKATDQIFDLICGMAYLRNYNLNTLSIGDTVHINAFLEDTIYDFNIVYYGKEHVKTKVGKFNAHVLKPIMPKNKMFSGTQPVTVWLSDDQNRVPVRIDADFVVGKGKCVLSDFKNLKNKPNLLK